MELIYKTSDYCEFTVLGLIDQWENEGNVSAYEIARKNNIPMSVWWEFYNDYKVMKAKQ